jgi:5'-deoxynucleotidase
MGNSDFADAKLTIEEYLKNMNMKEVDFFMEKFLPAYSMTLDESVTRLEG